MGLVIGGGIMKTKWAWFPKKYRSEAGSALHFKH
jgi:hypothetical protein